MKLYKYCAIEFNRVSGDWFVRVKAASEESVKIYANIYKGEKPRCMTKIDTLDNMQLDGTETEKVTSYTCSVRGER